MRSYKCFVDCKQLFPRQGMLLISMIKLLFLFFLSARNVRCWFLLIAEGLTAGDFHTQKYFKCSQSLQLSKCQLPSICTIRDTRSSMEILKQEILHNNYCQQHDHTAGLRLLNHFYFESFSLDIGVYIYIYIYLKIYL